MLIAKLFDHNGPFATVYLDARSDVENAASLLALRWKNARRELDDEPNGDRLDAARAEAAANLP